MLLSSREANSRGNSKPMNVPFLDLRAQYRELQEQLDAAYRRVAESGRFILGPEVEQFESEFAAYCGAKHCVGAGNGLDALHLILRAAGIGSGDEVIVPGNTYIATWLAVSYAGATPIPVEPDERTYNIDTEKISSGNHFALARDHGCAPLGRAGRYGSI